MMNACGARIERPFADGGGSARKIETAVDARGGGDPFHAEEFRAPRPHWLEVMVFGGVFGAIGVFLVRTGIQTLTQLGPLGCVVGAPFTAFIVEAWLRFATGIGDRWQLDGLRLVVDDGVVARVRLPRTPLHTVLAMIAMPGSIALMFVVALGLGLIRSALGITGAANNAFAIPVLAMLAAWMLIAGGQRVRRLRRGYYDLVLDRRARTLAVPPSGGGPRELSADSILRIETASCTHRGISSSTTDSVRLVLRDGVKVDLCAFREHCGAAAGLAKWIGGQLGIGVEVEV